MLKDMELYDYIALFPALKMPEGFHLLVKHFEIMYPSSNKYFDLKWPSIKQGIQILTLEKHLWKDGECYNDVIALMLLPLLFPPTTVRSGKRSWRPSKLEVSKSFILQVNNPSDIHQVVEPTENLHNRKNHIAIIYNSLREYKEFGIDSGISSVLSSVLI
nr:uncharacterized protein LOC111516341 [Leptinotarsa decemlineata]